MEMMPQSEFQEAGILRLRHSPRLAIGMSDKLVCRLIMEGVPLVIVGKGLSCAGSDVAQMSHLGTEGSVLDSAGGVETM